MQPKKVSYSNGPAKSDVSGYFAGKREFRTTQRILYNCHSIRIFSESCVVVLADL